MSERMEFDEFDEWISVDEWRQTSNIPNVPYTASNAQKFKRFFLPRGDKIQLHSSPVQQLEETTCNSL